MCQLYQRLPAMRTGELSAAIIQVMSKCLWSGCKWYKGYKEIAFTYYPVNREYSWNKSRIVKKKSKLCFTTCKNRLSMYVDKGRLESFMTEAPIIQKPVHRFVEQINGLVSIWQELPYSLRYIPWLWQYNGRLCIQISNEDAFY